MSYTLPRRGSLSSRGAYTLGNSDRLASSTGPTSGGGRTNRPPSAGPSGRSFSLNTNTTNLGNLSRLGALNAYVGSTPDGQPSSARGVSSSTNSRNNGGNSGNSNTATSSSSNMSASLRVAGGSSAAGGSGSGSPQHSLNRVVRPMSAKPFSTRSLVGGASSPLATTNSSATPETSPLHNSSSRQQQRKPLIVKSSTSSSSPVTSSGKELEDQSSPSPSSTTTSRARAGSVQQPATNRTSNNNMRSEEGKQSDQALLKHQQHSGSFSGTSLARAFDLSEPTKTTTALTTILPHDSSERSSSNEQGSQNNTPGSVLKRRDIVGVDDRPSPPKQFAPPTIGDGSSSSSNTPITSPVSQEVHTSTAARDTSKKRAEESHQHLSVSDRRRQQDTASPALSSCSPVMKQNTEEPDSLVGAASGGTGGGAVKPPASRKVEQVVDLLDDLEGTTPLSPPAMSSSTRAGGGSSRGMFSGSSGKLLGSGSSIGGGGRHDHHSSDASVLRTSGSGLILNTSEFGQASSGGSPSGALDSSLGLGGQLSLLEDFIPMGGGSLGSSTSPGRTHALSPAAGAAGGGADSPYGSPVGAETAKSITAFGPGGRIRKKSLANSGHGNKNNSSPGTGPAGGAISGSGATFDPDADIRPNGPPAPAIPLFGGGVYSKPEEAGGGSSSGVANDTHLLSTPETSPNASLRGREAPSTTTAIGSKDGAAVPPHRQQHEQQQEPGVQVGSTTSTTQNSILGGLVSSGSANYPPPHDPRLTTDTPTKVSVGGGISSPPLVPPPPQPTSSAVAASGDPSPRPPTFDRPLRRVAPRSDRSPSGTPPAETEIAVPVDATTSTLPSTNASDFNKYSSPAAEESSSPLAFSSNSYRKGHSDAPSAFSLSASSHDQLVPEAVVTKSPSSPSVLSAVPPPRPLVGESYSSSATSSSHPRPAPPPPLMALSNNNNAPPPPASSQPPSSGSPSSVSNVSGQQSLPSNSPGLEIPAWPYNTTSQPQTQQQHSSTHHHAAPIATTGNYLSSANLPTTPPSVPVVGGGAPQQLQYRNSINEEGPLSGSHRSQGGGGTREPISPLSQDALSPNAGGAAALMRKRSLSGGSNSNRYKAPTSPLSQGSAGGGSGRNTPIRAPDGGPVYRRSPHNSFVGRSPGNASFSNTSFSSNHSANSDSKSEFSNTLRASKSAEDPPLHLSNTANAMQIPTVVESNRSPPKEDLEISIPNFAAMEIQPLGVSVQATSDLRQDYTQDQLQVSHELSTIQIHGGSILASNGSFVGGAPPGARSPSSAPSIQPVQQPLQKTSSASNVFGPIPELQTPASPYGSASGSAYGGVGGAPSSMLSAGGTITAGDLQQASSYGGGFGTEPSYSAYIENDPLSATTGRLNLSASETPATGRMTRRRSNSNLVPPSPGAERLSPIGPGRARARARSQKEEKFSNQVVVSETVIGSGAYGTVYLAVHKVSGELIAVKSMEVVDNEKAKKRNHDRATIGGATIGEGVATTETEGSAPSSSITDTNDKNKDGGGGDTKGSGQDTIEQIEQLASEIRLMKQLDHPNIVKYHYAQREEDQLLIYMELMSGGSLASLMQKFECFSEEVMKVYMTQVLEGLSYLHEKNVVHRDIKADNILMSADGTAKISDFGTSREFADTTNLLAATGTPWFMAPEVINGETATHDTSAEAIAAKAKKGTPADIWSIGCTILELITGSPPFSEDLEPIACMFQVGTNPAVIMDQIPEDCSDKLKDLLEKCFEPDPEKRITAEGMLQHPFFVEDDEVHSGGEDEGGFEFATSRGASMVLVEEALGKATAPTSSQIPETLRQFFQPGTATKIPQGRLAELLNGGNFVPL